MQQKSIGHHQKSSLHRPWPCSWSNQVNQAHPDFISLQTMLPQNAPVPISKSQISSWFCSPQTCFLVVFIASSFLVVTKMRDLKTWKCLLQAGDDLKRQSQPLARILGRPYNHGSVFRRAMMMRLRPVGLYVHYNALPWTYLRSHISISRRSPPDRKGASFGNHSLQPGFVTYKGTIRALHICHSAPKKREKKPRNATPRRREP